MKRQMPHRHIFSKSFRSEKKLLKKSEGVFDYINGRNSNNRSAENHRGRKESRAWKTKSRLAASQGDITTEKSLCHKQGSAAVCSTESTTVPKRRWQRLRYPVLPRRRKWRLQLTAIPLGNSGKDFETYQEAISMRDKLDESSKAFEEASKRLGLWWVWCPWVTARTTLRLIWFQGDDTANIDHKVEFLQNPLSKRFVMTLSCILQKCFLEWIYLLKS